MIKRNPTQQRAIAHLSGPMMVLAGPGSGKTSVIVERTAYMINEGGISPSNILVVTFSRAAAKEMKERFLSFTGQQYTPVTFGTFHGVFYGILKQAYGFTAANILSDEEKFGILRELTLNYGGDLAEEGDFPEEIAENYARIEDIRQTLFEIFEDEAKKKNLELHYTINIEHEHILTDITKVKEIFVNILSNAIKYTPSGGSVMLNIDELACDEPGYMIVRTSVSDTGIGMSRDYLTKIFDAFTRERNTTKSKITGSGLGMSIVKKYVDLLGGTIEVESELGKGSTFTVTLKYRIADESYYVKNNDENPETCSEILEGKNILLAEDNDLNAEIAEVILERAGLKIERVEDGIQCVNRIMKMPAGTYDMILMDIQMPQMDGYKATRVIRHLPDKDKACIPIIAMTANAFEEDKRKAIEAGMNDHIAKPIQVDKLLSTLKTILTENIIL